MKGYYKNKAATEEAIDKDGWLHTGDIGFLDSDNFLHITDRKKNIIVTAGGKNVTPATIENLLVTSPYIEQVMVLGDKRKFLSALIVPSYEALEKYASNNGIEYSGRDELLKKNEIHQIVGAEIQKLTGELARFEQVRKFTLLPEQFTIEGDEITPSLKIKRKVISEKFADIIEQMYEC